MSNQAFTYRHNRRASPGRLFITISLAFALLASYLLLIANSQQAAGAAGPSAVLAGIRGAPSGGYSAFAARPTPIRTIRPTKTSVPTRTAGPTHPPTRTPSATPSATSTPSSTPTATQTLTSTSTATQNTTATPTPTKTLTPTPTETVCFDC